MSKKQRVKIDGTWKWVTNILEKDGPKLSVLFDEGSLFFWANEGHGKEEWVRVDAPPTVFTDFLLSRIPVGELMKRSKMSLYKRAHQAYDVLERISSEYRPSKEALSSLNNLFFSHIRRFAKEGAGHTLATR